MKYLALLSNGIDSAVSAYLLKAAGHTVIGLHFITIGAKSEQMDKDKSGRAYMTRDALEAERHAAELRLDDFICLNVSADFEEMIIRHFADSYCRGTTPNPCIRCNRLLKFGKAIELAERHGADRLSTGHYIRCEYSPKYAAHVLRKGADVSKDQSYFLSSIQRECLPMLAFPLGSLLKREVREIAQKLGFSFSEKKDSQEICFIPGNSYQEFLASRGAPAKPGDIFDQYRNRIGTHSGYQNYTIGQRTKMQFFHALPEKLFVYEIDASANRLFVAPFDYVMKTTATISETNWFVPLQDREYRCLIRKKSKEETVRVSCLEGDRYRLSFSRAVFAVTPGQTAVLYDDEGIVIGSGVIEC